MKTVDDWIAEALLKPTLAEALSHVAIYETERAVKQAEEFRRTGVSTVSHGGGWDTCFKVLFERVLSSWTTRNDIAVDLIPRSVPGQNAWLGDREVRSELLRDSTIGPTIDLYSSVPISEGRDPHLFYRVYIQKAYVDQDEKRDWVAYRYWPDREKWLVGYLNKAYLDDAVYLEGPLLWNVRLVEFQKERHVVLHKIDTFEDSWIVIGQSGSIQAKMAFYGISGLPVVEEIEP